MTFWALIRSIVFMCLCAHPITLGVLGVGYAVTRGNIDGLFAVLATPMTLAFFGPLALSGSLFVIVPTYYAFSFFGHRKMVPFAVFAVGASILLYLFIADPPPTGGMPGYDQGAQAFAGASLILWALYALFRMDLRQS
jgi:hypothetical protein